MQIANYDPIVETVVATAEKADGTPMLLQVNEAGELKVSGGGSSGGGTTSGPVTVATNLTITAASTPQQVFAETTRSYLLIQNNSDTEMRLAFGTNPTLTSGILLPANGGGYVAEDAFVPSGAVNIICSVAGKTFYALQGG
jgi:hypothetical protein